MGGRPAWPRRAWGAFLRGSGLGAAASYGRPAWLLAIGTIVSYLGRGAAVPFVVLYLTQVADLPLAWIGLGVVAEQVTRAVASPIFGSLSDRHGRKPFMVAGVLLQSATFPAYLLVDNVASYVLVCVLAGFGQAPYQPALSAYLADVTPKEQRVGVFGLVHTTKNLGWGLGVVMGGVLIARSFTLLFVVGGALPLAYALLLMLFLREPAHAPREEGAPRPSLLAPVGLVLRDARFAAFIGLAIIVFLTWGQLNTVLPVFISEGLLLDATWITRAFALNSILIILFQIAISARVESWSRPQGLAVAGLATALGYLVLAATPRLWHMDAQLAYVGLGAGVVLLTVAEMVETPLVFTLAAEMAPAGSRGGAMGVLALAAPLGMGLAPFLAGTISEAAAWPYVWHAFAALVFLQSAGFWWFGHRTRADAAAEPASAPS